MTHTEALERIFKIAKQYQPKDNPTDNDMLVINIIMHAVKALEEPIPCENCGKTYPHPYCLDDKLPGLIATMSAWRTDEATDAELCNAIDGYLQ